MANNFQNRFSRSRDCFQQINFTTLQYTDIFYCHKTLPESFSYNVHLCHLPIITGKLPVRNYIENIIRPSRPFVLIYNTSETRLSHVLVCLFNHPTDKSIIIYNACNFAMILHCKIILSYRYICVTSLPGNLSSCFAQ